MDEYRLSDDPVPEELLAEQEKLSTWNTHKVYFDNETGDILAISNEELPQYQFFFNISSENITLLQNEKIEDYKVTFNENSIPTIVLKPKQDESTLFLTKIEEEVDNPELLVEKNLKTKGWNLSIRQDKKDEYLKMGVNTKLEFFVTEKDNKNILIRKMSVLLKTLCETNKSFVPFVSHREEEHKSEIYVKKFFTTTGLKITYGE